MKNSCSRCRGLNSALFTLSACLVAALELGSGPAARAQLVADGATYTINGNTTNLGATILYVGSNGPNTTLSIINAGKLTNATSYIGLNGTSTDNRVIVTSLNSVWRNNGFLYVGWNGSFNSLLITNGGTVSNTASGFIGVNPVALNNQVVVSGANSAWNNGFELSVGASGSGNTLLITGGGKVRNSFGIGAVGLNSSASNNQAVISGPNSVWNSSGDRLSVGEAGWFNTLLITNGGTVSDSLGIVGRLSGANYNQVIVNGANSAWNNSGQLQVGASGSFNSLLLTNGGTATNYAGSIGYNSGALSNQVTVSGANSTWKSDGVYVGFNGSFSTLLITNGGTVSNTYRGYIGIFSGSSNNQAIVTGPNSTWNNDAELYVGQDGSLNFLLITNGGKARNNTGRIGSSAGAIGNQAIVNGSNSAWNNSSSMYVGESGSFNTLLIENGGTVTNGYRGFIGSSPSAISNHVTVSGPNSSWKNGDGLYLGGSFNSLLIAKGGTVTNGAGSVGGTSNRAIVSDANSVWYNSGRLNVGTFDSFNTLLITNGGKVICAGSTIAQDANAHDNQIIVSGPGSAWTTSGSLYVGQSGSFNTLLITNGGNVYASSIVEVGFTGSGTNNRVALAGGTLNVTGGLYIGSSNFLSGNGTINGTLHLSPGGILSPGSSVGTMLLTSPPVLNGNVVMDISKSGATLANDQIQVSGTLNYGGSLVVTKLGATPLALGDSFQLFSANSGYTGEFSSVLLPSLPAGLMWEDQLLIGGSIGVVAQTSPTIGGVMASGTNLIYNVSGGSAGGTWKQLTSTNVALPLAGWITNRSGIFDGLGYASLTNGINPAEPQRYFRIKTP